MEVAQVPACAGMTEKGAGVRSGRWWTLGASHTPHLTSPLKGGRDELGRRGERWVGSCLRRNDGIGGGRNDA